MLHQRLIRLHIKKNLINTFTDLYRFLSLPLSFPLQSFFGRTYNNVSSISECKNNGECIINKKNRTACKACRLRKCLMVGMSKSGSRYGRRSNWFKIHCLLQEQQQKSLATVNGTGNTNNNNNNINDNHGQHHGIDKNDRAANTSPMIAATNTFLPAHFLTSLSKITKITGERPSKSPSDSGASSADPDDAHRDSSIESFTIKREKASMSIDAIGMDAYRPSSHLPYIVAPNCRLPNYFSLPSHQDFTAVATAALAFARLPNHNEVVVQSEPMDLSLKTKKRRRSSSKSLSPSSTPLFAAAASATAVSRAFNNGASVTIIDLPKPTPLDLTLVRSNLLSG